MQRMLGAWVIGMAILTASSTGFAESNPVVGSASASAPDASSASASSASAETSRGDTTGTADHSEATVEPAPVAMSVDPSWQAPSRCSLTELEQYARRRAFTLRLIEQRERQRFESEVAYYERKITFTLHLRQQQTQLTEAQRRQFDEQVAHYTKLLELTLRLQDERDLRDALEFARNLEIENQKLAFTRKLLATRQPVSE